MALCVPLALTVSRDDLGMVIREEIALLQREGVVPRPQAGRVRHAVAEAKPWPRRQKKTKRPPPRSRP